jgi:hypothetical protein
MLVPREWRDIPDGLRDAIVEALEMYQDREDEPLDDLEVVNEWSEYTRQETLVIRYRPSGFKRTRVFHVEFMEENPVPDEEGDAT